MLSSCARLISVDTRLISIFFAPDVGQGVSPSALDNIRTDQRRHGRLAGVSPTGGAVSQLSLHRTQASQQKIPRQPGRRRRHGPAFGVSVRRACLAYPALHRKRDRGIAFPKADTDARARWSGLLEKHEVISCSHYARSYETGLPKKADASLTAQGAPTGTRTASARSS